MARKKKSRSIFSWLKWIILLITTGGGAGGYFDRDLPVAGPLVQKALSLTGAEKPGERGERVGKLLDGESRDTGLLGRLANRISSSANSDPTNPYGASNGSTQASVQPSSARSQPTGAQGNAVQGGTVQGNAVQRSSVLVASFNIQVLGQSKMSKPRVVDILAATLRQFDVIAIQEVRAKDDGIIPSLVAAINADGSRYSYLVGPRLGRTVSTEQYAFVFNTNTIETDPSAQGTIQDPQDMMHREPYVGRFRVRTNSPSQAFTFWLVNVHTDPDEVAQEVDVLADVFQIMQAARADEDDVIMLGDFNTSETKLGRLGQVPGIYPAIQGVMTNTRQTKAYDNIIFHSDATREFTGRWGVFDLETAFGISRDEALKVSDHLPVWAEFQIWETPQPGRFANQNATRVR